MLKKMIAPIVVGLIFIIYYAFFFALILAIPMWLGVKLLLGIIPLALIGVMIAVVCSRIKEIEGGEEDDLSQY